MLQGIHAHLNKHGDAVKDVAFEVDDARAVYSTTIARGAAGVQEPKVEQDKKGEVVIAELQTFSDFASLICMSSRVSLTPSSSVSRTGCWSSFLRCYTTLQVAPGFCPFENSNPVQPFLKDRYSCQSFCLERDKHENAPSHRSEEARPRGDVHAFSPEHSSLRTYLLELHALRYHVISVRSPKNVITQYLVRWEGDEPQHHDCG